MAGVSPGGSPRAWVGESGATKTAGHGSGHLELFVHDPEVAFEQRRLDGRPQAEVKFP